jgi:DNA-binding SARP family transcriptional activator
MIDLRVLGTFDISADRLEGRQRETLTQPKRLALLLYLALAEPTGLQSRDRLVALLWPEGTEESSRHSLRNALHALRRALGDEAIITRGESYVGLNHGALHCDALQLRAHLASGCIDDAVALWTGDLVPGFHVSGASEFEHWLDAQREELLRAVRSAAWECTRELKGAAPAELHAVRRAVRLDPGDEPGVRWLMQALADAGDRAGALQAYDDLVEYFARELEAQPSAATRALADSVRSAGVAHSDRTSTAVSVTPIDTPVPARAPHLAPLIATPEPMLRERERRARSPYRMIAVSAIASLGMLAAVTLVGRSYFSHPPVHAGPDSARQAEAERAVLRLPRRYRTDTSAYSSYLRGLTLRFEFQFLASRDTLAALVEREPLYVPGLFGLAHAYAFATLNNLISPDESWPKVDALARRALALDSVAASAWLALAAESMHMQGDLPQARDRIAHANMLDSLDPDVAAMQSVWFRSVGMMDSAVTAAQRAHRLDPMSPAFARLVGKQLYFARRYEESLKMFTRLLTDDPDWTRCYPDMVDLYRAMGRPRDAVEWLRRARLAAGDSADAAALAPVGTDPAARRLLNADAHRALARLAQSARGGDQKAPYTYALLYAALNDTPSTLRWLDSMTTHHDTYQRQVSVDPLFDFLRGDERYRKWEGRRGDGFWPRTIAGIEQDRPSHAPTAKQPASRAVIQKSHLPTQPE